MGKAHNKHRAREAGCFDGGRRDDGVVDGEGVGSEGPDADMVFFRYYYRFGKKEEKIGETGLVGELVRKEVFGFGGEFEAKMTEKPVFAIGGPCF